MIATHEMRWYPQDANGNGDGVPLPQPPGGSYGDHPDVRLALAHWAFDNNLTHAIAVREDGQERLEIWIAQTEHDWEWMTDKDYA